MDLYSRFLYEELPEWLQKLEADTMPLWGQMTAQQMVEHLAYVVSYSNGRFEATPNAEPERLAYRKSRFFEKDVPFPRSLTVPNIPATAPPPQYPSLEASVAHLLQQIQRFDDYLLEHPDLQPMHPVLGPLNRAEWTAFHARHARHHLQQFGLYPLETPH